MVRRAFGGGRPVSLFTLGTMRALESSRVLERVVDAALDEVAAVLETCLDIAALARIAGLGQAAA